MISLSLTTVESFLSSQIYNKRVEGVSFWFVFCKLYIQRDCNRDFTYTREHLNSMNLK